MPRSRRSCPAEASLANPIDLLGSATARDLRGGDRPRARRPERRRAGRPLRAAGRRRRRRGRGGDQPRGRRTSAIEKPVIAVVVSAEGVPPALREPGSPVVALPYPGVGGPRARARRRAGGLARGRRRASFPRSPGSTPRPAGRSSRPRSAPPATAGSTRPRPRRCSRPTASRSSRERVARDGRRGRRRGARARLPGRGEDGGRRASTRPTSAASRSICATEDQVRAAVERIGAPVIVQPFLGGRRRAARRRSCRTRCSARSSPSGRAARSPS